MIYLQVYIVSIEDYWHGYLKLTGRQRQTYVILKKDLDLVNEITAI